MARTGTIPSEGVYAIPHGTPWTPPAQSDSNNDPVGKKKAPKGKRKAKGKGKGKASTASDIPPEPYRGDKTLANSIMLMRDSILAREYAQAVAEGDPGRVYEAMKVGPCLLMVTLNWNAY